jgi:hypothetical protein
LGHQRVGPGSSIVEHVPPEQVRFSVLTVGFEPGLPVTAKLAVLITRSNVSDPHFGHRISTESPDFMMSNSNMSLQSRHLNS